MGNRRRTKGKLFNSKDFLYELSDYLLVFELAAQKKVLGKDDRGQTLKNLNSTLSEIFSDYDMEFGESTEADLKSLYPVAKHLCQPKGEDDKEFKQWLKFNKDTSSYHIGEDIPAKEVREEMKKLMMALQCAHRRVRHLLNRME